MIASNAGLFTEYNQGDITMAWSEAARKAALEARRRKPNKWAPRPSIKNLSKEDRATLAAFPKAKMERPKTPGVPMKRPTSKGMKKIIKVRKAEARLMRDTSPPHSRLGKLKRAMHGKGK